MTLNHHSFPHSGSFTHLFYEDLAHFSDDQLTPTDPSLTVHVSGTLPLGVVLTLFLKGLGVQEAEYDVHGIKDLCQSDSNIKQDHSNQLDPTLFALDTHHDFDTGYLVHMPAAFAMDITDFSAPEYVYRRGSVNSLAQHVGPVCY